MISLLPLLALTNAHAGERWLANDSFAEGDTVYAQGGFVAGECWGSVYTAEEDGTFDVTKVLMLVGGSATQKIFSIYFYELNSEEMVDGSLLGSEGVAIQGSDEAFNELIVADLELGTMTVETGILGISVCFEEHDGYPGIARDDDGMSDRTHNWIFSGGWYQSSDLGLTGDWVMRACISGDGVTDEGCDSDGSSGEGGSGGDGGDGADGADGADGSTTGDSGAAAEVELYAISPTEADEGEAVAVILFGEGFADGAEARIGGIPIVGMQVQSDDTISGRTPTTLPAGTHDVEVVLSNGDSAYLPGAFTVVGGAKEEEGGCGCATGPGPVGGLLTALIGLLGLRRRRSS